MTNLESEMQNRVPKSPEDYYIDSQEQKPYQEPLPKTLSRQPEPDRFFEEQPDWFWMFAFWMVGTVIGLMGVCALIDMYKDKYNWLLALSWTSTAIMGIAGLALIQKYWLRR